MNLLDLIFPKFCAGCGKWGYYLCPECISNIPQGELVCPKCEKLAIGGLVHPLCKSRYGLDGLWSLGVYQNPLKKIIQKLKYRFVRESASTIVDLVVKYWARWTPQLLEEVKKDQGRGWVVVPVPLHPQRQRWRGFNQSAELGKLLASKLGLEYQEVLQRIKYTKPQVALKSWERKQNIKGAFDINSKFEFRNSNFLLVDDVWTTGSTLKECGYVLKRGGAKKVWAVTLAR